MTAMISGPSPGARGKARSGCVPPTNAPAATSARSSPGHGRPSTSCKLRRPRSRPCLTARSRGPTGSGWRQPSCWEWSPAMRSVTRTLSAGPGARPRSRRSRPGTAPASGLPGVRTPRVPGPSSGRARSLHLPGRRPAGPGERASGAARRAGPGLRGPDPIRGAGAALHADQPVHAGNRCRALPIDEHRQDASAAPVPEARREQPHRGRRAGPRPRPARTSAPPSKRTGLAVTRLGLREQCQCRQTDRSAPPIAS